MDEEDWQIAFEPYEGNPSDALSLASKLAMLRAYLDAQTIQCRQAIKALDLALEVCSRLQVFTMPLLTCSSSTRKAI